MSKNNWLLLIGLLGLATVYAVYFTDWFRPKRIEIYDVSRQNRLHPPGANAPEAIPVTFGFGTRYQITELKVVPLDAWQTNHDALPVWHLVSDSNSVPLKVFPYGQMIHGMRPAIKGVRAEPLESNVPYRLCITAGKIKGARDFELK